MKRLRQTDRSRYPPFRIQQTIFVRRRRGNRQRTVADLEFRRFQIHREADQIAFGNQGSSVDSPTSTALRIVRGFTVKPLDKTSSPDDLTCSIPTILPGFPIPFKRIREKELHSRLVICNVAKVALLSSRRIEM